MENKNSGKKLSARTRKMSSDFGINVWKQRRSGLNKILTLLSKTTRVSADPRAVEYTASQFNL